MTESELFKITPKDLTELDAIIALSLAYNYVNRYNLPKKEENIMPFVIAFSKGVSYARQFEKLTEEEKQKLIQTAENIIKENQKSYN